MGESLLALAVSGLVGVATALWNGWLDPAYAGIAVALAVLLLFAGQFSWRPCAALLFWSGSAVGACLGQAYAVWPGGDDSAFSLITNGAIGAVVGMLAGGLVADWWQARQPVPAEPARWAAPVERRTLVESALPEPRRDDRGAHLPVAPGTPLEERVDDQDLLGAEDYPVFEPEPV
jgi:hypothetical protein